MTDRIAALKGIDDPVQRMAAFGLYGLPFAFRLRSAGFGSIPANVRLKTSVNPRLALLTSDFHVQITASTRSIDCNAVPGND
jgi:hypothetical protein